MTTLPRYLPSLPRAAINPNNNIDDFASPAILARLFAEHPDTINAACSTIRWHTKPVGGDDFEIDFDKLAAHLRASVGDKVNFPVRVLDQEHEWSKAFRNPKECSNKVYQQAIDSEVAMIEFAKAKLPGTWWGRYSIEIKGVSQWKKRTLDEWLWGAQKMQKVHDAYDLVSCTNYMSLLTGDSIATWEDRAKGQLVIANEIAKGKPIATIVSHRLYGKGVGYNVMPMETWKFYLTRLKKAGYKHFLWWCIDGGGWLLKQLRPDQILTDAEFWPYCDAFMEIVG